MRTGNDLVVATRLGRMTARGEIADKATTRKPPLIQEVLATATIIATIHGPTIEAMDLFRIVVI